MKPIYNKDIYSAIEFFFRYGLSGTRKSELLVSRNDIKFKVGDEVITQKKTEINTKIRSLKNFKHRKGNWISNGQNFYILSEFDEYSLKVYDEFGNSSFKGILFEGIDASEIPSSFGKGKFKIKVQKAPIEFILYFMWNKFTNKVGTPAKYFDISSFNSLVRIGFEKSRMISILELINCVELYVVSISSKNKERSETFLELTYNFTYRCQYAFNIQIKPIESFDNYFFGVKTIKRDGKSDFRKDLRLVPKDIIILYQRATNTNSAEMQFIFFYHILEFYFNDTVYEIKKIMKSTKNLIKYSDLALKIQEQEKLRLTLKRFLHKKYILKLHTIIDSPKLSLSNYFKEEKLNFCKGNIQIDFKSNNYKLIIKNLTNRIYKIRNSIVHQKETESDRFIPTIHENELIYDNLLMRLLIEHIIEKLGK